MKKTIYSILAVTAGIILAGGCSKESIPVENDITGEAILSADLPVNLTKTSIDGTDNTKVIWSTGDTLSVWGGENNKFTISDGIGTTSGSFSGTVTTGTAQYALCPYSSSATVSEGVITTNIPRTQTVPASSFDPRAAIMVGTISGTTITFRHAVAYLKITAPDDVTNLVEITIESNGGVQLTGDAKFSASTGAFTATGTANKFVTVKPADGTFTAGGIYYAAVIPDTYTGGLTVRYLYKTDATHITEKTKSSTSTLELSAGTAKLLGAATSFDHTYNAVQLWENGPYWATTNIGANTETDYGDYYMWGATELAYSSINGTAITFKSEKPSSYVNSTWNASKKFNWENCQFTDGVYNSSTNKNVFTKYTTNNSYAKNGTADNKTILEPADDAATANWGTGWSIPTQEQLDALTKCSVSYISEGNAGIRVTGTGTGYTSNSIFLPCAGSGGSSLSNSEALGLYWSNQLSTSIQARYVLFDISDNSVELSQCYKYRGNSIRPVRSSL